ncbi:MULTISPECIES: hypothetical protein [unclassified Myxococcus]|nr:MULTISPECIES: hypothetical protein [unclassified Myxococcus]
MHATWKAGCARGTEDTGPTRREDSPRLSLELGGNQGGEQQERQR